MSGSVNIILRYDREHYKSIGALLESVKRNKNGDSIYNIYMFGKHKDRINFPNCTDETVSMEWIDQENAENVELGKVLYLEWNTLVLGDLSDLYETELAGYDYGAVRNIPQCISNFPKSDECYSNSVILIEYRELLEKWKGYKKKQVYNVKSLPIFFNLGLQELIDLNGKYDSDKMKNVTGFSKINVSYLLERAVIIRMDPEKCAEKYFDVILADRWLSYYHDSKIFPYEVLKRKSYVETTGTVSVDCENGSIPIFLILKDQDVAYVMALLYSLKTNLENGKKLDIRICYESLTELHRKMLLSVEDSNISVVLYNIQSVQDVYRYYPQFLAPFVFDNYKKVIYLEPKQICNESVSKVYEYKVENDYALAVEKQIWSDNEPDYKNWLEETVWQDKKYVTTGLLLINAQKFRQEQTIRRMQTWLLIQHDHEKTFEACFNEICGEYVGVLPAYWQDMWSNRKKMDEYDPNMDAHIYRNIRFRQRAGFLCYDGDENPWLDPDCDEMQLLRRYVSLSQYEQQILEDGRAGSWNEEFRMDISKLDELEKKTQDLQIQIQQLEQELNQERQYSNQYLYELTETRKSFTYKIGRMITWLPRKIRSNK